jgi:hypothetical protein
MNPPVTAPTQTVPTRTTATTSCVVVTTCGSPCPFVYSWCTLLYMFNDFLTRAGGELYNARHMVDIALWHASEAAKKAEKKGIPETEIAEKLGVSRMTVRKWLGK